MTPYELNVHIEEFYQAKEEEMKNDITMAYMTAYWQRVKKMPDIKKVLKLEPQAKEPQTDKDMFAVVRAMNAALGGKEVYRTNEEMSSE